MRDGIKAQLLLYLTHNRSQANLRMVKLNGSKFENKQNTQLFIGSEMRGIVAGRQFSGAPASFAQGPGFEHQPCKIVFFKGFCFCFDPCVGIQNLFIFCI